MTRISAIANFRRNSVSSGLNCTTSAKTTTLTVVFYELYIMSSIDKLLDIQLKSLLRFLVKRFSN